MKINVTKIIRPLDLGGKAPELSGQIIQTWINPTLAFMKERDEIFMEFARQQKDMGKGDDPEIVQKWNDWIEGDFTNMNNRWFAKLWSQADDVGTHWTFEEVDELKRVDPALLEWMKSRSVEMIIEYRAREKKS